MLGFTPFKKHANKFNYIPRYYSTPRRRPVNSAVPSCAANGPRMPDGNTSPGSTSAPSATPVRRGAPTRIGRGRCVS